MVKQLAREGARVAMTYVRKPEHADDAAKAAQTRGVPTVWDS